jgi:RNA polymerase sigma-70 factor, ECF subfamily
VDQPAERQGDISLIQGIVARDRSALERVFTDYSGAVKNVARKVLRNETLAEDVVQEVFVSLWSNPERFDPSRGTLRTLLLTMAHRRAVDIVRSEHARTRREEIPPDPVSTSVEDEVWSLAVGDQVRSALQELADGEREAIALAYLHGMTYVEVADKLGTPEGTVKSRIRSGMKKLSVSLREVAQT